MLLVTFVVSHPWSTFSPRRPRGSEDFSVGDTKLGVKCGVDWVGRPSGSAAQVVGTSGSAESSGDNSGRGPPRHFLCGDGNNGCLGGVVRAPGESLRAVSRLAAGAAAAETAGNVRCVEELEGRLHCPVPG